MLRAVLVRHGDYRLGEVDGQAELQDVGLNDAGRETSAWIARKLKEKGLVPDLIYTSPTPRAIESASFLSREFAIQVEPPEWQLGEECQQPPSMVIQDTHYRDSVQKKAIMCVTHVPNLGYEDSRWDLKCKLPGYSTAWILTWDVDSWRDIEIKKPALEVVGP